jgi:lipopolysaccharide transport protein LptA
MTFPQFLLFLLSYTSQCHSAYTLVDNDRDTFITPTTHLSAVSSQLNPEDSCCSAMKDSIEVACTREATFRDKTNVAEFFGRVVVRGPQFALCCDHLILTLRRDHQGIQHAEAIGNVVVIQENANSEGQSVRSIGRAGRAHYDSLTGNLFLTEWPQLRQGANNHIAMGKKTRMILNKDGHSSTIGQSKTVVVEGLQDS